MNALATLLILAAVTLGFGGSAMAQADSSSSTPSPPSVGAPAPPPKIDALPDGPPLGSLSLSQLMIKVEGEPEFAYVRAVEWRDGRYAVTFVTRDGESHEKLIDPRTGREAGRIPPPGASQTGSGANDAASSSGDAGRGDAGNGRGPVMNPAGTPSNAPPIPPRSSGPAR